MGIKKGYKQTEIGIIPEDWEIVEIGSCINVNTGSKNTQDKIEEGKYPFYVRSQNVERIDNYSYDCEAVLTAGDGVGTGKVFHYVNGKFEVHQRVYIMNNFSQKIDAKFFFFYFSNNFHNRIMQMTAKSSVDSVRKEMITEMRILLPSTFAEQTAIATALSDMDEYILSLERLIAKKKAIKQGAMQNLLTGKIRLKGFKGEWMEKKLGEILQYEQPTNYIVQSTKYTNRGIPVLTAGKSLLLGYTVEKHGIYDNLPVIIFDDFTTDSKFVDYKFKVKSSAMKLLTSTGVCNIKLAFALMQEIDFHLKDHQRYWISEYSKIEVKIPKNKAEQTAIATILSDMDSEIEALQAKLCKAKLIKQGTMQELLTGKIRLVNTSSQSQKLSENRIIPISAHVVGGHVVNKLYGSRGWGRTKLQKSMHLIDYHCQLDFGYEYIRNIAGPDSQALMNHIDSKFKQYRHVRIEIIKNDGREGKHYNYIPTSMITEIEQVFNSYSTETQEAINNLLNKIKKMDLARAEIVSTLYAVWNNRIIKRQSINDDLLLSDFYDWSAHKSDYSPDLVLRGLNYMRQEDIIPIGWGKYIDKKITL